LQFFYFFILFVTEHGQRRFLRTEILILYLTERVGEEGENYNMNCLKIIANMSHSSHTAMSQSGKTQLNKLEEFSSCPTCHSKLTQGQKHILYITSCL